MSSKKKLVISLSVAAAVLVAAIIAIVAVFAASIQTAQSTLKITFTSKDVSCTVSGEWALPSATADEKGELGSITIKASDEQDTHKLNANPTIPLTSEKNYVDLSYTFTNNGSRSFTIELGDGSNAASPLSYKVLVDEEEWTGSVTCDTTATVVVRVTLPSSAFDQDILAENGLAVTIDWLLTAINE